MYTLPLTCNQLLVITLPVLFIIGMSVLLTQSWYPFNSAILIGIALVALPAFAGFLYIVSWVVENVRCKCDG